MLKTFMVTVSLAGAAVVAPSVSAQTLYGYDSGGQLITINSATAATTAVGASAGGTRIGLARSAASGITYTRSFDTLYSVNLTTGVNTTIGASGTFLSGLAFNLAGTALYSVDQGSGAFYSINVATGAPTLIGQTNVAGLLDLATSPTGVIYASYINSSNLYTINTSTGAATLVTTSSPQALTAIGFAASGDLYGVTIGSDSLYHNVLTGPTLVGALTPNYSDVRALLFTGGAVTGAVPEPATWAMMILGMGAVGFAMRRRQKVTTRVSYAA